MTIRAIGPALLFCTLALTGAAAQGQTTAPPKPPALPTPSSPSGIGRRAFEWIDSSRPDRFSSAPNTHRRLMLYLWYPASQKDHNTGGLYLPGAAQMDANADAQRFMRDDHGANWPLIVSGSIYSHATGNAPVAKQPAKFPAILLSHGLGGSGFGLTSLIEDLVSHGYVVAAIEHTYTAGAVVFLNGDIVLQHHDQPSPGLTPEERFKRMAASVTETITEGAADVRFVLDKLIALDNDARSPLSGRLDLEEAAAMGHSAGAEFAARACQLDARFKECVDLDGGMVPVAALPDSSDGATMKQPLLFLEAWHPESKMFGTPEQHAAYLKKKREQLQTCCLTGSYAVELHSPGIVHGSFSDDPLLEAGSASDAGTAQHNLDLIETLVRAFLDQTLQGRSQTLLHAGNQNQAPEAVIRKIGP
jgi:alpha-beta hydrolase superfamily lysophospholipase